MSMYAKVTNTKLDNDISAFEKKSGQTFHNMMCQPMERTTITMDGYGRVSVPSDTANVWMSEMELIKLFDVIAPTLRAAIRAVYKSGVLQPCEVERRIRLPNDYYAEAYALPMVVAIAFRINTPNAARVRNALLERLCLRKDRQVLFFFSSPNVL